VGRWLALGGQRISGADAVALGLADVLVADEDFPDLAAAVVEEGPADALARFAREPEAPGSGFVPDEAGVWRRALCVQEERVVGPDNTVKWRGRTLQIPPSDLRPHFVRATVRLLEDPDGRVAVWLGPHHLADYEPDGTLASQPPAEPPRRREPVVRGMPRTTGFRTGQITRYEHRTT
jgi:hypothetical protein